MKFARIIASAVMLAGVPLRAQEAPRASKASQVQDQDQKQVQAQPRRTLREFQELAEREGGELNEQKAKIEYSRARELMALSKSLPAGNGDVIGGALPDATGNALAGQTDWGSWGPFVGARAELVQPLYTFGALGAAREAAKVGTHAEEALLERNRFILRTSVAEYYYGYQLAFELTELVAGVRSQLEEALTKGEQMHKRGGRGAPSSSDLDKLRVGMNEILTREGEANKGLQLARAAMSWKTGRPDPRWDRANLKRETFKIASLADYQAMAQRDRPEWRALRDDVTAKAALVRVEQGLRLPALYLGGRAEYSRAPGRQDQQSPFANDPLNDSSAGVFLGLRWNLGLFETTSKVQMARAELHAAEARLRHFGAGIQTDVARSFLDLSQAQEALKYRDDGALSARRVYQDALFAFGLRTGSAKDFLEALTNHALAAKAQLDSVYAFNVGIEKLRQATGNAEL